MMWDGYGFGAGWGLVMFAFMIVFVVAAIVAVAYFVRAVAQPQGAPPQVSQVVPATPAAPPSESPQDILKRRYAAGEIEREEYLQKLGDL